MKKSEAARKIQVFLESRGYRGNSDDGEALVDYLMDELEMYPPSAKSMPSDENIFLQVYVDNIDIPHWIILGWDNEEK